MKWLATLLQLGRTSLIYNASHFIGKVSGFLCFVLFSFSFLVLFLFYSRTGDQMQGHTTSKLHLESIESLSRALLSLSKVLLNCTGWPWTHDPPTSVSEVNGITGMDNQAWQKVSSFLHLHWLILQRKAGFTAYADLKFDKLHDHQYLEMSKIGLQFIWSRNHQKKKKK